MSNIGEFDNKEEEKKVIKARKKMKQGIEKRIGKTFSIPAIICVVIITILVIVGVHCITKNILSIIATYIFFSINLFISFSHILVRYYKEHEKKPPKLFASVKWILNKIYPVDYERVSPGSALILVFFYNITIGGVIAIFIYGFGDASSLSYLNSGGSTNYGIFTFIIQSMNKSMMPLLLFMLFILAPLFFCFFIINSALVYKNNDKIKSSFIIWFLPILSFTPILFNIKLNALFLLITLFIFLGAWALTLGLFHRLTKRSTYICIGIMFLQLFINYYVYYVVLLAIFGYSIDIMVFFKFPFILYYIGILYGIPLIIKLFDYGKTGKIKMIGVLISTLLAFVFQIISVNTIVYLFLESPPVSDQNLIEMLGGFGFFYFYLYLILIPLFFIFGYFQIQLARVIYRYIVKFGKKINYPRLFNVIAASVSIVFLVGLVYINYFFLSSPTEFMNAFYSLGKIYDGTIIIQLVHGDMIGLMYSEYYLISNLLITEGLLAYSSYRSAYNLAKFGDKVKEDTKTLRIVRLFREPAAYKSRILLGLAIISIFLGTISMYAFLRVHTVIFPESISAFSSIIFKAIDNLKLIVQIFGLGFGIALFLYNLIRK
ncbi:MAG: hypothetical protein ACTSRP_00110 [Candidatus Helarchaeota archaeon]